MIKYRATKALYWKQHKLFIVIKSILKKTQKKKYLVEAGFLYLLQYKLVIYLCLASVN